MNKKWLVPGIIIGVIAVIALIFIGTYNGLVTKREAVVTAFSKVQTQYQRRVDLVPNLVSTVKGAANFEKSTLTDVVTARTKATSITIDASKASPAQIEEYQKAQGELSSALSRLLAITENYPQLRATEAFRDLQVQLEGTENRIAVARNDYNDTARPYNTSLQRFPTNMVASLFNFEKKPYFEADKGSETVPTVDFAE
jgi:LemA protein